MSKHYLLYCSGQEQAQYAGVEGDFFCCGRNDLAREAVD